MMSILSIRSESSERPFDMRGSDSERPAALDEPTELGDAANGAARSRSRKGKLASAALAIQEPETREMRVGTLMFGAARRSSRTSAGHGKAMVKPW